MMNAITLIQPAPVQRDEYGNWFHPDIPTFYGSDEATEDSPKWKDWLKEQGLEHTYYALEFEDEDHPAYQSYYEKNTADISAWNPGPPDGEGWFLLSICDTEDGPYAYFVRRV